SGLDDFLQAAVSVVAYHMQSAVCSIYIYDDKTRMLTLRATQGLSPNAVGNVSLRLGQGLTGLALKELRAIREGRGSLSPKFQPISGINEEKYQAFLAVPIRRGLTRVGVLAVQDPQPDYFDKKDEQALGAIAAQLAAVIENATLLQELHRRDEVKPVEKVGPKMIKGRAASDGVARGKATVIVSGRGGSFQIPANVPDGLSVADFDLALERTEQQLKELQRQADEELSDVAQLIFNAHLLILADDEFSGEIRRQIEHGIPPAKAIAELVNRYIQIFSTSPNPRLQEKVHDLKDLGHRMLENLIGGERVHGDYSGQIIVADTLLPSDILKLATERAEGFIVLGGVTSHNAIICRSLQKPMVMIDPQQFDLFSASCAILVDGNQGTIYINPSKDVLKEYDEYEKTMQELEASSEVCGITSTADGTRVHLFANINLLSDLTPAIASHAEGVGLYRSEFPFIIRNAFPSEEEQYRVYSRIVEAMDGREVTFRTLDIGGDKVLSYQGELEEANPFLGLRAIRFSLLHKDIFSEQLCAFLRAGVGGNTRIMFPLIASLDDFLEARDVVYSCMHELDERDVPYNHNTKIGIMVEVPSAVEMIEDLAREVDFVSIGTNDLIQYTLAVDRTNDQVSKLYLSHHPAILRAIERVVSVTKKHGKDVSICGDMAMDPKMIPFLIGAGITKFSLPSRRAYDTQQAIQKVSMEKAVYTARRMLACSRITEVEALLNVP
ncbi:MAG: phosphoenolpyruvate--protein phosphotransferase, partial [Verrucomicrobia bacterium]|nr:phosphoenolpyruvate--protein phosphotransferase [Verrucomicrobiota bacterium]